MEFTEQEKKVLADKYETFKEEIELAMIQNCIVECELYSIIAEIIRGTKSGEKISLRDVSVRRKTKLSMWLHGAAGFPDFVVLERKKSRNARRYGCVEIKCPGKSNILRITKQVKGHIISYGRVIYTNGLQWKFYRVDKEPVKVIVLGRIDPDNQDFVIWEPVDNWYELMSFLEDWDWKS